MIALPLSPWQTSDVELLAVGGHAPLPGEPVPSEAVFHALGRQALLERGERPPEELTRPEVAEILLEAYAGQPVGV
jgi:hypothetical protein